MQNMRAIGQPRDLTRWILVGIVGGLACGLFFGELCRPLKIAGDAFVGLLRMTVLPYIAVTVIGSLGRLSRSQYVRLAKIGGIVMLGLWAITLSTVALLPIVFPSWKTGAFFSNALVEEQARESMLEYFIPINIFSALSENHVPAIILFCVFCGIALSAIKDREVLLTQLDVFSQLFLRISNQITRLSPLGIFAIAASTAGTVSLEDVIRLQAYLLTYACGVAFLGFIALPLLASTLTPLSYWQVLKIVKEPMLVAFSTGKLIVSLPMLVQNTERVLRESSAMKPDETPSVEVLYTTGYTFPHAGKLLSLVFIPFAAWFTGRPLTSAEYPLFLSSGLFAYFGGPLAAIPFLLDELHLPHDLLPLFLISGVIGERLGDALGAMHLAVLTLVSSFGLRKSLSFRWIPIARSALIALVGAVLLLAGLSAVIRLSLVGAEERSDMIAKLQLLEQPVDCVVLQEGVPNPDPLKPGETLLKRVKRRGILRVGYNEDKIPFAFFNNQGELVGYDINMAHGLARDLDVTLEFVRFDRSQLVDDLKRDHFDIVMSGLVGTLERSMAMQHTTSYMDVNLALTVPDYRARQFDSLESIREMHRPRIGFVNLSRGFEVRLRESLPEAELIEISEYTDYFTGTTELDALLISAESGAAFTLLYPEFEVVVPRDLRVKLPLFYAIAGQDLAMKEFLEHWITLRQKDGTAQEHYDHWILGKRRSSTSPRWSIIRDVLKWIE